MYTVLRQNMKAIILLLAFVVVSVRSETCKTGTDCSLESCNNAQPVCKMDSHTGTETGVCTCEGTGTGGGPDVNGPDVETGGSCVTSDKQSCEMDPRLHCPSEARYCKSQTNGQGICACHPPLHGMGMHGGFGRK